jgi:hypothetical protein
MLKVQPVQFFQILWQGVGQAYGAHAPPTSATGVPFCSASTSSGPVFVDGPRRNQPNHRITLSLSIVRVTAQGGFS